VHTGPFANIAHGNSSILADKIALKLADYVITESGFGADIGMEKFFDIKCRLSGLVPNAVLLVASIRALKMHSGKFEVLPGKPLDPGLVEEDLESVEQGCSNLQKHIENVAKFGVPCVVAVNKFTTDTPGEIEVVREQARRAGAGRVVVSAVWGKGGDGGRELAEALVEACEKPSRFRFLYPEDASITEKIETIAREVYGAERVEYSPAARSKIKLFTKRGWDKLPICMAKTHLSISHDPAMKGRPNGYVFPVRDIRPSLGAGFLYPLCGDMRTIPGLPSHPAGEKVDIDADGRVVGLS
jgi:formyltetrahydrofolate synthetase